MTPLSIVIPTYNRGPVLLQTVEALRAQSGIAACELLIVDQTELHDPDTDRVLRQWDGEGSVRWLKLPKPSIPAAMNRGLEHARNELILFLDDDIQPRDGLLEAHAAAHAQAATRLIAGRVTQPWDSDDASSVPAAPFSFNSGTPRQLTEFMAGNFSVSRAKAIAIGGFDENFVGAAYRFEREFADRWIAAGYAIWFQPAAGLRHLKAERGGVRTFGSYLTTASGHHAVGEYYYWMTSPTAAGRLRNLLLRPIRAVATRHHLRKPWYVITTLIAELSGLGWALWLRLQGPRLLPRTGAH